MEPKRPIRKQDIKAACTVVGGVGMEIRRQIWTDLNNRG